MRQVLEQYISDFSTHKTYLELLLKQRFLGPPLDSDLVDLVGKGGINLHFKWAPR